MPQDAPMVSIGLPVRNAEQTVAAVAKSVLAQDYANLELVISDNASTDGTQDVCEELARSDERVRYHRHPENVGLLNNFVGVIAMAKGVYFRWISDSDALDASYSQVCVDAFAADPRVVLVTTGVAYQTEDGQRSAEPYTGTALNSDDPAERAVEMLRLLNESYRLLDPLYGMMRRVSVLPIPRRNMLREDQVFAVKLALAGPWAHVPAVLAQREWRTGPTSSQARLLSVPAWQAHFANTLQMRELLRVVADADLTAEQRSRVRAAIYAMFVRRQRMTLRHRSRKLARLALRR